MRQALRRILIIYFSALLVMVSSVVFNLVLKNEETVQLQEDTRKLNIGGQQGMLSQRIIYLAESLAQRPDPVIETDLKAAIARFEASISFFDASYLEASHLGPSHLGPAQLGQSQAGDATSLDMRIREYIATAQRVVENPADRTNLNDLRQLERSGLLADINQVVDMYESQSVARTEFLRRWEWIALCVALAIVFVEVVFVFLPGHRFVSKAMAQLERRNRTLQGLHSDLQAREKSLADSLAVSQELQREQAEFTYAVSHDLKAPTNSMRLFLDELKIGNHEALNDDGRQMLEYCQQTASRMAHQVEDLLSYAGVTDMKSMPEKMCLSEIVDEVRQNLDGVIRESGAQIVTEDLPFFFGHRTQIRILVQNLVENAIKYRAPDRVPHIVISTEPVARRGVMILNVKDNGIGIPQEHQERIFHLFERLHLRSEVTGSGLGLCTSSRIARNHGGEISVTSLPEQGATFTVQLCCMSECSEYLKDAA